MKRKTSLEIAKGLSEIPIASIPKNRKKAQEMAANFIEEWTDNLKQQDFEMTSMYDMLMLHFEDALNTPSE